MRKYNFEKLDLLNEKDKHVEPKYSFTRSFEIKLNTNGLDDNRKSRSLKRVARVGEK